MKVYAILFVLPLMACSARPDSESSATPAGVASKIDLAAALTLSKPAGPPMDGSRYGSVTRGSAVSDGGALFAAAAATTANYTAYSWSQGDQAVVMLNQNDGWCFLNSVTGHFVGQGEAVWIYNSNGYWVLTGQSGQQGVGGEALCFTWSTLYPAWSHVDFQYDGRAVAYAGNGPANLALAATSATCALMGVGGAFAGSGEMVSVNPYGIEWQLTATSGQQNGTEGWAGCFEFTNLPSTYQWVNPTCTWSQGQPACDDVDIFTGPWGCGLTMMTGHFAGTGESVTALPDSNDSLLNWWILSGTSGQSSVGANMGCFGKGANQ